ncbi:MAG: DNA mismatch repair protein MutS [Gammaproteobacteria bacterium]|nr:DNA mismatch repair protein MutS [Gammaproteobacteria bacterium]
MKRPREPHVTDEDRSLFHEAVRDAVPLPPGNRQSRPSGRAPPPVPVQSLLDEHAALAESVAAPFDPDVALDAGEETSFVQAGVSRQVLRRLRRGHWVVQAELDLHGMRQPEAHAALGEFLGACIRRKHRCVRVVHGKGLGSVNREPVLKGRVRGWLARRSVVLAFCQAPATQGGSGALLVLLRG